MKLHLAPGLVALLALSACAAAKSPALPSVTSPRSVEEAEAEIARAKADIEATTSSPPQVGRPEAPPTSKPPVSPAPPPPPASEPAREPASPASVDSSGCSTPCRALASMRRAVGALCELTGTEDIRCVNAVATLASSEARVGRCACP